jgi:transposase-like protein
MQMKDRKSPSRRASSESRYSLMEFMAEFSDDEACLQRLWRDRYSADGTNAHCSKCEAVRPFHRYGTKQQRQSWTCTACGHHVHPTAGTIYHKSSTSLHLWFYAMYLMTSTRCGISAKQLERELGVTYKTAWRTFNKIRSLLDEEIRDLSGEVETDETFYGGKYKNKHANKKKPNTHGPHGSEKQPIWGAMERGGRVVACVVPDTKGATLIPNVIERVMPRSTVYSDEAYAYDPLKGLGFQHKRVHHAAKIYVEGNVHVNSLEGFWSLLKRGIGGVYHSVSAKHLQSYVSEYAWRYNHRNDRRAQFDTLLVRAAKP